MKLLYVALAHEYGDPALGPSFEEMNFRSALEGMGHEVVPYDFKQREEAIGRDAMRQELIGRAADLRPDAAFFFLFEEEIDPDTVRTVAREGRTVTLNWFADDHWRFRDFTRRHAPAFDWAITTDPDSLPRYRDAGIEHVLLSQWACNRYAYRRPSVGLEHDLTFVGQPHGDRREVVARLGEEGLGVECWGQGWPNGRIGHEEMVRIFASSRVNLNLANSSTPPATLRFRLGALVRGRRPPGPRPPQIKGRTFEVPGSGGFLLTDRVPHMERYFELGREIAVFDDEDDLVAQARYWLEHPEERTAVAEAGYERVMAEHTYDHRFAEIFQRAGLA